MNMFGVSNLNIKSELLPIFDYTKNRFAKGVLLDMLERPLLNREEVYERQHILKALIARKYPEATYYQTEIEEIYDFLVREEVNGEFLENISWKIKFSGKFRMRLTGHYIQVMRFFDRCKKMILDLEISGFPPSYHIELKNMLDYLQEFMSKAKLDVIRNGNIRNKYLIDFSAHVKAMYLSGASKEFWKGFFRYEAFRSISICLDRRKFTFPCLDASNLSIEDFYHPLLDHPIKSSLTTTGRVVLITGPNMSGKSTLLRSLGICVFLAHLGFGVPAKRCKMPFFNCISVNIDHSDDLKGGYSHFMREVAALKEVVQNAINNKCCFAVFDEIFKGTNIDDALEITKAIINGLNKFVGCFFIISTHLHQLRGYLTEEMLENSCYYLDSSIQNKEPVFTYEIKRGWSDLKFGKLLFEKEGLDKLLGC